MYRFVERCRNDESGQDAGHAPRTSPDDVIDPHQPIIDDSIDHIQQDNDAHALTYIDSEYDKLSDRKSLTSISQDVATSESRRHYINSYNQTTFTVIISTLYLIFNC